MRSSTKSLLVTFGTVAALTVTPLVLDLAGDTPQGPPASAADTTISDTTSAVTSDAARTAVDEPAPPVGDPRPGVGAAPLPRPGSTMGGDLPPEYLPTPPYPQCAITDAGNWWTDPADPYTCRPPEPISFHEPTPPGIDPELLQPIFEEPISFHEPTPPGIDPELLEPIFEDPAAIEPAPGADCRTTGSLQCTVSIMGQNYVVTFSDGQPVGVVEAR